MGMYTTRYIGAYVEAICDLQKVMHSTCRKPNCPIDETYNQPYCNQCGESLQYVKPKLIDKPTVDPFAVAWDDDGFKDNLIFLFSTNQGNKQIDIWLPNLTNRYFPYQVDIDDDLAHCLEFDYNNEKVKLELDYADEMIRLNDMYGENNVTIKFGLIQHTS